MVRFFARLLEIGAPPVLQRNMRQTGAGSFRALLPLPQRNEMKEKELSWLHFQEVMAAIQHFLDQESKQEEGPWASAFAVPFPASLRAEEGSRRPSPEMALLQFYLSRQKPPDLETLRSLPAELFIRC